MIFENNKFLYFTRPDSIKTYLNKNNIEKKKLPFDKSFSWKNINKDNYKEFVNENDKIAKDIAQRGRKFIVEHLRMDDIACYWQKLLTEYTKLLKFKPKLNKQLKKIS